MSIHTSIHMPMHVSIQIFIHVSICTSILMYVHMAFAQIHAHVCTHVHAHTRPQVDLDGGDLRRISHAFGQHSTPYAGAHSVPARLSSEGPDLGCDYPDSIEHATPPAQMQHATAATGGGKGRKEGLGSGGPRVRCPFLSSQQPPTQKDTGRAI